MSKSDKSENGATDYIMERIHEYGISCVNLHIRNRESGFGGIEDERKHQQAVWCAIRDMINNEISMLQDACSAQAGHVEFWKKEAQKKERPITNFITGSRL